MRGTLLAAVLILLVGAGAIVVPRLREQGGASPGSCTATVRAGGDVTRAIFDASEGSTVCLASGTHRPFKTARARPGVTVRGAGRDTTTIQVERGNGIEVAEVERFTLTGVTVRGGSPAGIFISRARDIALEEMRVEAAAIGVHAENGVNLRLHQVRIARTTDFALLVRRGATATVQGLEVVEPRGIGIGAVDEPGVVTLTDVDITRGSGSRGEGMVLNGYQRFALANVTVRGGDPAGIYVARARELSLREVRVEKAKFGLHLDENAVATLDGVDLVGSTGIGLLIQRGATLDGLRVRIQDTNGTGLSA